MTPLLLLLSAALFGAPPAPATSAPAPIEEPPGIRPEHREQLEVLPPSQLDVPKAKGLFAAGKAAAQDGRWDEAVTYFAEAYRYSGSPGQLYSLGRSHRELYFFSGRDPVQLRLAILRFEQYLDQSPAGRNRDNASRYIDELRPYANVLEGFDEPPVITRLMVHSPQADARVVVDGDAARPAPTTFEVTPGPHRVEVRADGFEAQVRTVEVPAGATVPIEFVLAERPAALTIEGPPDANVMIDGTDAGALPSRAVELSPGRHQVAVGKPGYAPFVREFELRRGEARTITAELPMTTQRKAAIATLGLGGGALLGAAVVGGLAASSQSRAQAIDEERREQGISMERFEQQQRLWTARDRRRVGAYVSGAAGVALVGTGLALWLTDRPRLSHRVYRPEAPAAPSPQVRLRPAWGPRLRGAVLTGRF